MTISTSIRVFGGVGLWVLSHWSYGQHYQAKGDYAFPTTKIHFYLVNDDQPLQDADMDGTKELTGATFIPHQAPTPAEPHIIEVAESMRAYEDGHYADAAQLVTAAAQLEPTDPTILNCYARALYHQGEEGRRRSYPIYQRLIGLLDHYGREDKFSVAVYTLFLEAYFKLATLQLDNAQCTMGLGYVQPLASSTGNE